MRLFLLNIFIFVVSFIFGQKQEISFEKERLQSSMLSSSITTIAQDNTGFLWLGTEYGLVRFDGYSYISFFTNEEDENGLPSNIIKRIIKNKDGNIWIGTDHGIAYVDIASGLIIRPAYARHFDHLQINTICEDTEGNLWIGTNEGVKVINPQLQRAKPISISFQGQKSFNVNFIDIDNGGNIWIGSNFGFCAIKKVSSDVLYRSKEIKGKIIDEKTRLGFFKIDNQNRIWINNDSKNYIFHLNSDLDIQKRVIIKTAIDAKSILILNNNQVLVGSRWNGITELEIKNDEEIEPISHLWMNTNSTTDLSNTVNVLFEDNSGNIWAGTKAGLFVDRKSFSTLFHNIKANERDANSLSHNAISSLYQTKNNNIWIGTSSGLNEMHLENGEIPANPIFQHFNPPTAITNAPSSEIAIQCIVEDKNQQLWAGTKQSLLFFDPAKKQFYKNEKIEQFIKNNNISLTKAFYRDSRDNIWIGFTYGGLVFYSADNEFCTQIKRFAKSDVWAIAKDHSGNMWIGTHNGLFRFNSNMYISQISENTKEYKHISEKKNTIPANWITSIQVASNGDVWIGTSEGLCKYNSESDDFQHIELLVGSHPPYISGITEDLKGDIWISTTSGIFRKGKKESIEYFELAEGNFSSINYTFGHLLTEKGQVLLGGIAGLVYFLPEEIIPDSTKQNVFFSQLLLSNRNSASKNININDLSKVTIKHNEKQFSIQFSTLNYASPTRIKYSYRIKEISKDWIYLDGINNITFSNLPQGKYTLEVRSSTASGFWQKDPRSIQLVVLPPWWKTTLAYVSYVILFLLGLFFIMNWLRAKDKLVRQNELNHFKLVFYTNLLHSINGPLSLMQAPLNNLIKNHRKMSSNEISEMLAFLQRNSKRLSHTMMQLLEFRKIDRGKSTLHISRNDIIALLSDVYESFSELAESKQIHFTFDKKIDSQMLIFDFEKIEIVLFNLLSNAFKFTEKGGSVNINAELSTTKKEFFISISDTGIGIAPENQVKIFERFWQVYSDNSSSVKGTGIGLSLANDFVEAHHGKIDVKSEIGKGSTFTITLLVGDEHFGDIKNTDIEEKQVRKAENVAHFVEIEKEISIHETNEFTESKKLPIIYILAENKETLNFLFITLSKEFHVFLFEKEDIILEKMKELPPSLIISDIYFHSKPLGLEFCLKIKKDILTSHIPFVLLAHNSSEEEKLMAYEAGTDAYIEKPVDVSLLSVRIEKMLKMRDDIKEKSHREMISNPQDISIESQDTKFLQDAMAVIEENMEDENFTLDEFAEKMKVSRSKLNSRMLSLTGQTPIEFLRNIRLKRAAQLLRSEAFTISEISYKVGISDPRYFSTIFKKQYGVSPLQYAKKESKKNKG